MSGGCRRKAPIGLASRDDHGSRVGLGVLKTMLILRAFIGLYPNPPVPVVTLRSALLRLVYLMCDS